jgi:hypothetical protein
VAVAARVPRSSPGAAERCSYRTALTVNELIQPGPPWIVEQAIVEVVESQVEATSYRNLR